jgi:LDH2 family malate/lactate/ureidoglycolate dehydrogenase
MAHHSTSTGSGHRTRPDALLDSATAVAHGKVYLAVERGTAIPEGWAADADGNPTTELSAETRVPLPPSTSMPAPEEVRA